MARWTPWPPTNTTASDLGGPERRLAFDPVLHQRLHLARAGAGIAGMVDFPAYRDRYSVGVSLRSREDATARLLVSRADNPEAASFEQSLEVGKDFRASEFLDVIRGSGRCYLFILFDRPGTYWVDDLRIQ